MDALIVLLFLLPGLFCEYLYEKWTWTLGKGMIFFKFLRALFFNIPITLFAWFVIWFWKVALHGWPMIPNLATFWTKCISEPFLGKYALVLFVGVLLFAGIYALIFKLRHKHEMGS